VALSIQPLSADHDRVGFDCGSEPLNSYLRQNAHQHADRGVSKTFVLVEDGAEKPQPILGYFTLSICQIVGENLPPEIARKFPRTVGGVRLGRLAIATHHQRKGYGQTLLADALKRCRAIADQAGGIGLFVDGKDEHARAYYGQFGFVSLTPDPLQMFLPIKSMLL